LVWHCVFCCYLDLDGPLTHYYLACDYAAKKELIIILEVQYALVLQKNLLSLVKTFDVGMNALKVVITRFL
jgi:hypothetical protein